MIQGVEYSFCGKPDCQAAHKVDNDGFYCTALIDTVFEDHECPFYIKKCVYRVNDMYGFRKCMLRCMECDGQMCEDYEVK